MHRGAVLDGGTVACTAWPRWQVHPTGPRRVLPALRGGSAVARVSKSSWPASLFVSLEHRGDTGEQWTENVVERRGVHASDAVGERAQGPHAAVPPDRPGEVRCGFVVVDERESFPRRLRRPDLVVQRRFEEIERRIAHAPHMHDTVLLGDESCDDLQPFADVTDSAGTLP